MKEVEFFINKWQLALINNQGKCLFEPGKYRFYVGGQQPDPRSAELTGNNVLSIDIDVVGEVIELEY